MSKKRDSLYVKNNNKMNLINVEPLTDSQYDAFTEWDKEQNLILHGYAGTGKTYLALYMALESIGDNNFFRRLVIIRSAVPSRDLGFLPGRADEKAAVYEEPYENIVNTLYGRGDAYLIMKKCGTIDFRTTSYMRGVTYDKAILLIDEIQNMNEMELHTILTRVGEDARFILCGDFRQSDLTREKSGLNKIFKILDRIKSVSFIEFGLEDIVRSGFVKDYLVARELVERDENDKGK